MISDELTFDQVYSMAQALSPTDQARLVARLASKIERIIERAETSSGLSSPTTLRGTLADLGPAPTDADIDAIQQEMWAALTQEQ